MAVKKHYIPYISLICGILIIVAIVGLTLFFKWEAIQKTIGQLTCQERLNTVFYCH